jgi:hypothetical protein
MISIYIETTVFNRYLEEGREFCTETRLLFEKIAKRKIKAYTSVYVIDELQKAPEPKRTQMLDLIANFDISMLEDSQEAQELADDYVNAGIIPARFRLDGVHVAITSINNIDCIISLNFQHINKLKTKTTTEAIHNIKGYNTPYICTPMEVFDDEQF